jgi:hypothetical protein
MLMMPIKPKVMASPKRDDQRKKGSKFGQVLEADRPLKNPPDGYICAGIYFGFCEKIRRRESHMDCHGREFFVKSFQEERFAVHRQRS